MPRAQNGILAAGELERLAPAERPTTVEVLAPGAEPRAPLRYATGHPTKDRTRLTVDIETARTDPGSHPTKVRAPRWTLLLDLEKRRERGEDRQIRGVIVGGGVAAPARPDQAEMADVMRHNHEQILGRTFEHWMAPDGTYRDRVFEKRLEDQPEMTGILAGVDQWLRPLLTHLPSVPVGVGARWRIIHRSRTATGGLEVGTYTLVQRRDRLATIDYELESFASPGALVEGQPVREMKQSSRGSATVDLDRIAPTAALLVGTMAVRFGGEGAETSSSMQITLALGPP